MKHLFLLSPPCSGSTALWHMLGECNKVATMELDEGEKYWCTYPQYVDCWSPVSCRHGFAPRKIGWYESEKNYNWPRIIEVWNEAWDKKDDDRVYLEKSTPNVFRWKMLDKHFENAQFIAVVRNPYSWTESMLRHNDVKPPKMLEASQHFIIDWVTYTLAIKQAYIGLGPRMLVTNYEHLAGIPSFMNELRHFSRKDFRFHRDQDRINEMPWERLQAIGDVLTGKKKPIWTNPAPWTKHNWHEQIKTALNFAGYGALNRPEIGLKSKIRTDLQLKFTGKYINNDPRFSDDRFVSWTHGGVSDWMLNLGVYSKEMTPIKEWFYWE